MTETKKSRELFKALADPVRLDMFYILAQKEMCVCELCDVFGMSEPRISRHLGILKRAGLVKCTKYGKWHFFSISEDITAKDILNLMKKHFADEFKTDAFLLSKNYVCRVQRDRRQRDAE